MDIVVEVKLCSSRAKIRFDPHRYSIHGKALSALGEPVEPIIQNACAFQEDQGYFDDYTGIVLDETEGKRLAAALGYTRR
ncbi:MAG: hypothetical protein ACRDTO_00220 [Mycobacterium sp.]